MQTSDVIATEVLQIFDCKVARHGNMIVGRTGAGKTVAWRTLTRALAALKESHPTDERYQRVHPHILNPLALSNDEIYGCGCLSWHSNVLYGIRYTATYRSGNCPAYTFNLSGSTATITGDSL